MDSVNQVQYYSKQLVSLMNSFETNTKRLMSDSADTSDLEMAIWNASDEKDLIRLKALHNKMCKLVDDSEK